MPVARRFLAVVAVLVLLAATLSASTTDLGPLATPDRALDALWNAYGDRGGHWTGGDRTASVALPDGRVVWLFSDTFLGRVNRDGSRPPSSPFVHNSMVVESDGRLGPTITGGPPDQPQSVVGLPGSSVQYWVADATVEGDRLRVLFNLLQPKGIGGLDLLPAGTALATFALPDLTLVDLHQLPLSTGTAWGSSILEDGNTTYVYGSEYNGSGPKYARLARVARNGLSGPWQFWTGHGWSARESDSARLLTGVGTAYSVTKVGRQYVLVTMDTDIPFSRSVVAYPASAPTGPFGPPTVLLDAPEAAPGPRPIIAYDATAHPEQGRAGTLVISYNVNSLDPDDNLSDVSVYRPRFVDVPWPPRPALPGLGPPPPTGLAATVSAGGTVHLGWTSAGSGVRYRLYERDVSFGQTYFARLPSPLARTGADLPYLLNGHTYDLQVSTVAGAVEGRPSAPVRLTVHTVAPPAPTGLSATPDPSGAITLRWSAPPGPVSFIVYQRDRSAGQAQMQRVEVTDTTATAVTVGPLTQDHSYDFAVSSVNGAGASAPTAVVTALAHADPPPPPTGLRADATADGRVVLSWRARPGDGLPHAIEAGVPVLTYHVFQSDLTAAEADFTRWPGSVDSTQVEADLLRTGHTYEFTVAAAGTGGDGPPAPTVRVRVVGGLPDQVTAFSALPGDGQVALAWPARPGLLYLVYRCDLSLGEGDYTQLPVPVAGGNVSDTIVHNGHLYLYEVAAANVHGTGPRSAAVFAQPLPPRPGPPTGLRIVAGDRSAALSWNRPGRGDLYYFIYRRDATQGGDFQRFPLPVTTGTAFTDRLLTNGDTYEYRVSATNLAGEGPPSAVVSVRPRAGPG